MYRVYLKSNLNKGFMLATHFKTKREAVAYATKLNRADIVIQRKVTADYWVTL